MDAIAINQALEKLKEEVSKHPASAMIAILGKTPAAYELRGRIIALGLGGRLLGIYSGEQRDVADGEKAVSELASDDPAIVVVASDDRKEDLISEALPHLRAQTRLVIGGFRHFAFRDQVFDREVNAAFVQSFANGYPTV